MDHPYSGQSINLSCISSLQIQEPLLVFFQVIVSARQTLGLVFHLGFQTPSLKCHSLHTLMAPGVLHMVVNLLEINLGITSWSNEIWVGLGFVVFLKPYIKSRIASSDLFQISGHYVLCDRAPQVERLYCGSPKVWVRNSPNSVCQSCLSLFQH